MLQFGLKKNAQSKKKESILYLAIENELPSADVSVKVATQTVKDTKSVKISEVKKTNRNWWHQYYKKSFISMPDDNNKFRVL